MQRHIRRLWTSFFALNFAAFPAHAEEMTIMSWGGVYQDSQQRALHDPYSLETGINIINDARANDALNILRATNSADAIDWDVIDTTAADAITMCDEGLTIEIDPDTMLAPAPDGTSASDDFGNLLVSDCFVPQNVYSTVLGYRTDLVADAPPTDICDLFDLQTYPGKRALQKSAINNMVWALMCDGVENSEVYDVLATDAGQTRALAKLNTIKKDVIWWSSAGETTQLLADGEIVMGSTFNGRLFSASEEQNLPIATMWDGQIIGVDGWVVPQGLDTERTARALDYIRFASDTQRQADQTRYLSYGPARMSSLDMIGQHADLGIDMAPHMPTDPSNTSNSLLEDYEFQADHGAALNQTFLAWVEDTADIEIDDRLYKAKVRVLFGTNRTPTLSSDDQLASFGTRASDLQVGEVEVWVPKSHVIGNQFEAGKGFVETAIEWFWGSENADEFRLKELSILSMDEFQTRLALAHSAGSRSGFVYIHGFATPFEFAAQRTAQLAFDLRPFAGAPMFFSWPSLGKRKKSAYFADENMAEVSRMALKSFLLEVLQSDELDTVHIIAHSLGARLFAETMRELKGSDGIEKLGEIVLAAPDISTASFSNNFQSLFASDPAKTTVYVSDSDWALSKSSDYHGDNLASHRLGQMDANSRIFADIDTIDISSLDGSFGGHSVVQQNPLVLRDLFEIYSHRRRPFERHGLQQMTRGELIYWAMKGK